MSVASAVKGVLWARRHQPESVRYNVALACDAARRVYGEQVLPALRER